MSAKASSHVGTGTYVVWKRDRYGTVFLYLDGPFQYPRWTSDFDKARGFVKPTAYRWAALEDGEVVNSLVQRPASLSAPGRDEAPETDREPAYGIGIGAY